MTGRSVVLDTNVIVSAGIQLGTPPGRIVEGVLDGDLLLHTCPAILGEYLETLARPRFKKYLFPPAWLPVLLGCATCALEDPPPWPVEGPDPDDLVFLAHARRVGAVLVTGNGAHYPASIRLGVEVWTPREFLDLWIPDPNR